MASRRKKRTQPADPKPSSLDGVGPGPFGKARRWASRSALALLLGIGITATNGAVFGPIGPLLEPLIPWFAAVAMAAGIAAAHHVGRCGPDPGDDFLDAHPDR